MSSITTLRPLLSDAPFPARWSKHVEQVRGNLRSAFRADVNPWMDEAVERTAYLRLFWDGAPVEPWPAERRNHSKRGGAGRRNAEQTCVLQYAAAVAGTPEFERRPKLRAAWEQARPLIQLRVNRGRLYTEEREELAGHLTTLRNQSIHPYRSAELLIVEPDGYESIESLKLTVSDLTGKYLKALDVAEERKEGTLDRLALDPLAGLDALLHAAALPPRLAHGLAGLRAAISEAPWEGPHYRPADAPPLRLDPDDAWQDWLTALVAVLHVCAPALVVQRPGDTRSTVLARDRELIARATCYWERARLLRGHPAADWLGGADDVGGLLLPHTPYLVQGRSRPGAPPFELDLSWADRPRAQQEWTAQPGLQLGVGEACWLGLDNRWAWKDRGVENFNEWKPTIERLTEVAPNHFALVCGLSGYDDYVTTELAIGRASPLSDTVQRMTRAMVRDDRLAPIDGSWPFPAHSGVSAAVVTAEGLIPLPRQNRGATASGGLIVPPASGSSRVSPRDVERLDPRDLIRESADIEREIQEELRDSDQGGVVDHVRPIALVRDALRGGKIERLYVAYLGVRMGQLHLNQDELERGEGAKFWGCLPAATRSNGHDEELLDDHEDRLAWIEAFLGLRDDAPGLDIDPADMDRIRQTVAAFGGANIAAACSPFVSAVLYAYRDHVRWLASR